LCDRFHQVQPNPHKKRDHSKQITLKSNGLFKTFTYIMFKGFEQPADYKKAVPKHRFFY